MKDLEKFLSLAEMMYMDSHNNSTRIESSSDIVHSIKTNDIEINSIHFLGSYFLFGDSYLLDIKYNKLVEYLPAFYNDNGIVAETVFNHLEQISNRTKKGRIIRPNEKKIIFNEINNPNNSILFRNKQSGADFLNLCQMNTRKINIESYEEYNACVKSFCYRVLIKNNGRIIGMPKVYNSVNSNDVAFAKEVYTMLHSYVR